MGKHVDLVGQTFGRLMVIAKHPELNKHGSVLWQCQCSCDARTVVLKNTGDLRSGNTTSCGCARRENTGKMFRKHGLHGTPEYSVWKSIIKRCTNPNFKQYNDYGGRGISICDRWRNSFEAFLEDMGPRPSAQHSIERRDNDKGYYKENCFWATKTEQANNTRANVYYELNGEKFTIAELAEKFNFPYSTMRRRLLFLPVEAAVDASVKFETYPFTLNGVTKTMKEWLEERNISVGMFVTRRYKGWSISEALEPIHLRRVEFEGQFNTLEFWCTLLGFDNDEIDVDVIYLRVLRGEDFEAITKTL